MIKKIFNYFKKKERKINLIKFHLIANQYNGVIGWQANDLETLYPAISVYSKPVKGEDTWQREGELKK